MNIEAFFAKVRSYTDLAVEAERAWSSLLRPRQYARDEAFIRAGDVPTSCAFIVEGLLCQHYVGREGDLVIKYFFPENRIAASVSATLLGEPSLFAITAIESSHVPNMISRPSNRSSPNSQTFPPSTSATWSGIGSSRRSRTRSHSGMTTRCSATSISSAASRICIGA